MHWNIISIWFTLTSSFLSIAFGTNRSTKHWAKLKQKPLKCLFFSVTAKWFNSESSFQFHKSYGCIFFPPSRSDLSIKNKKKTSFRMKLGFFPAHCYFTNYGGRTTLNILVDVLKQTLWCLMFKTLCKCTDNLQSWEPKWYLTPCHGKWLIVQKPLTDTRMQSGQSIFKGLFCFEIAICKS